MPLCSNDVKQSRLEDHTECFIHSCIRKNVVLMILIQLVGQPNVPCLVKQRLVARFISLECLYQTCGYNKLAQSQHTCTRQIHVLFCITKHPIFCVLLKKPFCLITCVFGYKLYKSCNPAVAVNYINVTLLRHFLYVQLLKKMCNMLFKQC